MPERSYRILLWSLAVLGLAADQATKYGIFGWLKPTEDEAGVLQHRSFVVFQTEPESHAFSVRPAGDHTRRGFFLAPEYKVDDETKDYVRTLDGGFEPYVNQGALFGWKGEVFGYKLLDTPAKSNRAFAIISVLAAAAIVYWSMHKKTAADRWLCVSLGLILAGTLGNFYDRLAFTGVRDFMHWHYGFDWPVFNVADCCLVVGASLLLLQAFFVPASQPSQPESEQAELAVGSTQG
jgi:signal peptidase II